MYYAYVLRNRKNTNRYIGHCENISVRLKNHNDGKVKSTKSFIPWYLAYKDELKTRNEAIEHEKYLKSGIGRQWLDENGY